MKVGRITQLTTGRTLPQMSRAVADLNRAMFEREHLEDQAPMTEADALKLVARDERELQAQCETYLTLRGYLRLTPDNATRPRVAGWFAHLAQARGNPLLPDIVIYDATMTRCLCVELKTANRYQPGQLDMISRGAWQEVRTLEAFRMQVDAFEADNSITGSR